MRKLENKWIRVLSVLLSCALIFSDVGVLSYAAGAPAETEPAGQEERAGDTRNEKDEMVYVLADVNGSARKIIVSNWIKNVTGSAQLQDQTALENIENLKGDESYTINGENLKIWDAAGNDLYYQGTIDQELPVNLSVRYRLDGEPVSAEELAGKSGRVTIRFDYTNTQYEWVDIDGRQEQIYVPFLMLTGLILDHEQFRNIQVSNGKLINDGDRTIIAGFALPGLAADLKLDAETLEIPDYVEISADATNFSLATTVTIATNEIFNEISVDGIDSFDGLTSSVGSLTAAVDQLIDGSSALYNGLAALLEQSGALISGIDRLAAGASALNDGSGKLSLGALQLQEGAAALCAGLDTLSANNETLCGGARQIFESLLSTADTQLAAAGLQVEKLTAENYAAVLNSILAQMDEQTVYNMAYHTAHSKVEEAVRAQEALIRSQVEAAVRQSILESVLAKLDPPVTPDQLEALSPEQRAQINAIVEQQIASEEMQAAVAQKTDEQIQALIDEKMKSDEIQSQIQAAVESARAGASSIARLKEQLDGYDTFYQGLLRYTAGVAEAGSGAEELRQGAGALQSGAAAVQPGAQELYSGIGALQEGSGTLVEGVSQLKDGAMQLSDGLQAFKKQGVSKLADAVNGDLNSLLSRIRATSEVSRRYRSFSGISDEMDGQVTFIYKTDGID